MKKNLVFKVLRVSIYVTLMIIGFAQGLFNSINAYTTRAYPELYIVFFLVLFVLSSIGLLCEMYKHNKKDE